MVAATAAELPPDIRDDPPARRRPVRGGGYAGRTGAPATGLAPANRLLLPAAEAEKLRRHRRRNPPPCLRLAVSEKQPVGDFKSAGRAVL